MNKIYLLVLVFFTSCAMESKKDSTDLPQEQNVFFTLARQFDATNDIICREKKYQFINHQTQLLQLMQHELKNEQDKILEKVIIFNADCLAKINNQFLHACTLNAAPTKKKDLHKSRTIYEQFLHIRQCVLNATKHTSAFTDSENDRLTTLSINIHNFLSIASVNQFQIPTSLHQESTLFLKQILDFFLNLNLYVFIKKEKVKNSTLYKH